MASCELVVTYRCRTWLARSWVRLMTIVAPVVGRARAVEWAIRGARLFIRVDITDVRPSP